MKKKMGTILFVLSVFFLIVGGKSYAEANEEQYQSELNIFFDEPVDGSTPTEKPQKPIIIGEQINDKRLPQLGEMVKNLIILLIGISIIILIIGMYFIKQLCKKNLLEVCE